MNTFNSNFDPFSIQFPRLDHKWFGPAFGYGVEPSYAGGRV